jgi:phosphatidylinositol alpha-1,6-mannosyltransferase
MPHQTTGFRGAVSAGGAADSHPVASGQPGAARGLGRAGLGVITFSPSGGGVAYVARLLRAALTTVAGSRPWTVELEASQPDRVSAAEQIRFGARVLLGNVARRADWFVFGHAGIAEAQRAVPRPLRRPYAVQLHGTEVWEPHLPESVRRAALRIAPSRYTAERARATHPDIGPIAICPHALLDDDTAPAGTVDAALVARVRPESVVIIGRLWSSERRKGHDQLIGCWPLVRAAVPGAQLVIVGDGDDLPRLRDLAHGSGIAADVLFTGYVSDATRDALLRRSAVFAMPSRQEGFGLVYVEAMRAGLPCIGATDDGATEPIVAGVTGLLVEQRDLPALAAAVSRLLADPVYRRALGEAGRRRYLDEFTFPRYCDRLATLLSGHFGPGAR